VPPSFISIRCASNHHRQIIAGNCHLAGRIATLAAIRNSTFFKYESMTIGTCYRVILQHNQKACALLRALSWLPVSVYQRYLGHATTLVSIIIWPLGFRLTSPASRLIITGKDSRFDTWKGHSRFAFRVKRPNMIAGKCRDCRGRAFPCHFGQLNV
jgi:hypothetical protein